MEGNPNDAENDRPGGGGENPERQGPGGPGPANAPNEEDANDREPSGPPPESLPGGPEEGTTPHK
jgi:hypothetical protein